jgi:hypothetical protein
MKRFALIGNCQMAALSHYIRWLPEKHMSLWLCRNKWVNSKWPHDHQLFGSDKIKFHVFDKNKKREILQTCDVIFYQPNFETIELINKNSNKKYQTLIEISPIFVNDLEFMQQKEKKYNTSIKASNIIRKHKHKKPYIKKQNHPSSLIFLDIMKELCDILNIQYYNDADHHFLLNKQYPNY